METRKVIDAKGKWFVNTGAYPIFDPESKTVFEPQVPTQATATKWLENQPTLTPWSEPGAAKTAEAKATTK